MRLIIADFGWFHDKYLQVFRVDFNTFLQIIIIKNDYKLKLYIAFGGISARTTYIPTDEGWLYLATVIDLYSRKIVGWSMSSNMKAELVNDALLMALWKRKPSKGLVWHTDRGSQYASDSHLKIIKQHQIIQSMSRKGNCWDNAVAESFFHTLKTELTHQQKFKTREEAKHVIFEYIEVFYNRQRLHSANDYMAPAVFEAGVIKC